MSRPGHVLSDHGEQFDHLGFDCLERALKFLSMLGHGQSLPGRRPDPEAAPSHEGQRSVKPPPKIARAEVKVNLRRRGGKQLSNSRL
jgi:hypothetical protein